MTEKHCKTFQELVNGYLDGKEVDAYDLWNALICYADNLDKRKKEFPNMDYTTWLVLFRLMERLTQSNLNSTIKRTNGMVCITIKK